MLSLKLMVHAALARPRVRACLALTTAEEMAATWWE